MIIFRFTLGLHRTRGKKHAHVYISHYLSTNSFIRPVNLAFLFLSLTFNWEMPMLTHDQYIFDLIGLIDNFI